MRSNTSAKIAAGFPLNQNRAHHRHDRDSRHALEQSEQGAAHIAPVVELRENGAELLAHGLRHFRGHHVHCLAERQSGLKRSGRDRERIGELLLKLAKALLSAILQPEERQRDAGGGNHQAFHRRIHGRNRKPVPQRHRSPASRARSGAQSIQGRPARCRVLRPLIPGSDSSRWPSGDRRFRYFARTSDACCRAASCLGQIPDAATESAPGLRARPHQRGNERLGHQQDDDKNHHDEQ